MMLFKFFSGAGGKQCIAKQVVLTVGLLSQLSFKTYVEVVQKTP